MCSPAVGVGERGSLRGRYMGGWGRWDVGEWAAVADLRSATGCPRTNFRTGGGVALVYEKGRAQRATRSR